MQLESLKRMDRGDARDAIGIALDALLKMGVVGTAALSGLPANASTVVNEIATQTGVELSRATPADQSRLVQWAENALTEISVGSIKPKEVRERLGTQGLLEPERYVIQFSDHLAKESLFFAVKPMAAQSAIQKADAYQHLFRPEGFDLESPLVSLFVRVVNCREVVNGEPAIWHLVSATRTGDVLRVDSAWQVHAKEIEIDASTARPLDLLRAFADRFGLPLRSGSRQLGKFILYEKMRIAPSDRPTELLTVEKPPQVQKMLSEFRTRVSRDKRHFEIAIGYAINIDAYHEALRHHGIKA